MSRFDRRIDGDVKSNPVVSRCQQNVEILSERVVFCK